MKILFLILKLIKKEKQYHKTTSLWRAIMSDFKTLYQADMHRYNNEPAAYTRRLHFFYRKAQCCKNKWIGYFYKFCYRRLATKRHLEISSSCKIGKGLYLGHIYNITINPHAVIGENCNIHKNVSIGMENRGKRQGCPVIGNRVWIGINTVIVGNVCIGDDVMIAPNSFVNCDVPSHSVVFGNPCVIKPRKSATDGYINNIS